jgi:hypothetical protein
MEPVSMPPVSNVSTPSEPVAPSQTPPVTPTRKALFWLIPIILLAIGGILYGAYKLGWLPGSKSSTSQVSTSSSQPVATSTPTTARTPATKCPAETSFTVLADALAHPGKACSLGLVGQGLKEFPADIFKLVNLEELYLSDNQIAQVPSDIGTLKKLRVIVLRNNKLATLPSEIGSLSALTYLNLEGNTISATEQARIRGFFPVAQKVDIVF